MQTKQTTTMTTTNETQPAAVTPPLRDDFCIFILTHGRPDNQKTLRTLGKMRTAYPIYFVCDDGDKTLPAYIERYGQERVMVFSKSEQAKTFDTMDNFATNGVIVYARNACYDIARRLGYRYFLELDDDYENFAFYFSPAHDYGPRIIKKGGVFDGLCDAMLQFLSCSPHIKSVAFMQDGDYIGGGIAKKIYAKRKAMNSFFCDTEKRVTFFGKYNEDVNLYTQGATTGDVFFTTNYILLHQAQTQHEAGGMSEEYRRYGTYVKSFYTVMACPSAVTIRMMGVVEKRLHHHVNYKRCAPRIIDERYCKRLAAGPQPPKDNQSV